MNTTFHPCFCVLSSSLLYIAIFFIYLLIIYPVVPPWGQRKAMAYLQGPSLFLFAFLLEINQAYVDELRATAATQTDRIATAICFFNCFILKTDSITSYPFYRNFNHIFSIPKSRNIIMFLLFGMPSAPQPQRTVIIYAPVVDAAASSAVKVSVALTDPSILRLFVLIFATAPS